MEDELVRQTALLADLVGAADPALAVPSCPGWTIGDLAEHVGLGHRWATGIVTARASEPVPNSHAPDKHAPADPAGRAQWLRTGATRLVAAVRQAGAETRMWTWSDDQTAGFWLRRIVHETVMHRGMPRPRCGAGPRSPLTSPPTGSRNCCRSSPTCSRSPTP
jgi:uncharacterized protein (TIGR03083 family)